MTVFITVLGVVQGIGYRPFVARLAEELKITGSVKNSGGIVEITASGSREEADTFIRRLRSQCPSGGQILQVLVKELPEISFPDFMIEKSAESGPAGQTPILPPDLPLCDDCLRELRDSGDRRYRYPFISCVSCGPRYSIIHALPYDRDTTTMEDFPLCAPCEGEYTGNGRRRHAQTISCHDCGPQLIYRQSDGILYREEAFHAAVLALKSGAVVAVKGIGGYQFACDPCYPEAVRRLRFLKHRDKKPFAVLFSGIDSLLPYCVLSEVEQELLLSPARPIVLLKKQPDRAFFCPEVSGESRYLGAFLAYTPLHQLLLDECGPLVMTSGNLTGEPVVIDDQEMLTLQAQSPYLSGVLYSERRILMPLDDSVAHVVNGSPQLIRRSRGYVPLPLFLRQTTKPILAMGGDLKAGFCLYQDDRAYLSQYFGDMEHYEVCRAYEDNLQRMSSLLRIEPELIIRDLHPGYITSALTKKLQGGIPVKTVQHHHAHIGSVMAEHRLRRCIGVAFDGTGYGTDGAVWGGEFLVCQDGTYERMYALSDITICGGDSAAKNAAQTAACYRYAAGLPVDMEFQAVATAISLGINTTRCSSMGRLFDAVSALLGIRTENTYEGECAIALENAAAQAQNSYPLDFDCFEQNGLYRLDQAGLFRKIAEALDQGVEIHALALGFHHAVARAVATVCVQLRDATKENKVALSGGVFANVLLTEDCVSRLKHHNFDVYLNSAVPTNDGGICLGQAWIAAQQ